MSDKASGRNPATNAGSDSGHHYRGPASHQYKETTATPISKPEKGSIVGNSAGTPGKTDERSAVRS